MEQTFFHKHDGIDTPQIDPKNLLGFPIFRAIPTFKALEGTQIFVILTGAPDTYYLYAMLDKVWRGVQLPL